MPTTRKALNYDLDDRLLQKYYPNPKSYKNAWGREKKPIERRIDEGITAVSSMRTVSIPRLPR